MTEVEIWRFLLSLSVAFPAMVGALRFKKIDAIYNPLLFYIFLSLVNELLMGFLIVPQSKTKTLILINNNLFYLFEAIIFLVQFKYWGRFQVYSKLFPEMLIALVFGWTFENLIVYKISHFHVYFLIAYSFFLVLLAVQTINHIIVNDSRLSLLKNPKFIICVAIIIFFIYTIFVYTLMAKGLDNENKKLVAKVFGIQVYINAIANILYGIALLFVQKKVSGRDLFKDLQ